MSRTGMQQGDIGWGNLPERGYVSKRVREVLKGSPGLEITTLQVWNALSVETRRTIANAYGDASAGRRAVHKSLMNLKGLHGNPKNVRGSGDANTVWLYTGPRELRLPEGEIVHTTETPLKPLTKEQLSTIIDDGRKKDRGEFEDYHIPATPIDETFPERKSRDGTIEDWGGSPEQDPLEALLVDHVPQVGDTQEFVIVGKLSDGSYLWRKESDGTLGFIEFNAL